MKIEFIKIGKTRYRLSTIKQYEPFHVEKKDKPFGLYIYFSAISKVTRDYHYFRKESERSEMILKLDEVFNTKM